MVDVTTQNKTISVNVSSSGVSSNVNASSDTTLYYSNKAREWAISNRIVDGVDYSSKYYAGRANQSALNAQSFAQSAQDSYNNFQDSVDGALSNIDSSVQGAIEDINNTKTDIITDIEFVADGEKQEIEDLSEQEQNKIVDLGIDTRANVDLSNLSVIGEKHFLNKSQITDCLLEVPQRIKLELNDGTLTLKAGSEVIVPNGAGVFDEVVIESDLTTTGISYNKPCFIMYDHINKTISVRDITQCQSGTSTPTSAISGVYIYYNTSENKVYLYDGNAWIARAIALPLCIVNMQTATPYITSIDQIFNGMGYIGSTVWLDKGVKGLIPNGRNEDGTLRNIEYITSDIITRTYTTQSGNIYLWSTGRAIGGSAINVIVYNENQNIIYDRNVKFEGRLFARATLTNGVILSFQPKQPFKAVDHNDIAGLKAYITETYRSGTSWYRVYSDGWCEQGGVVSSASTFGASVNQVTLLKAYRDIHYIVIGSKTVSDGSAVGLNCPIDKTTTAFTWSVAYGTYLSRGINWEAKGYIA